MIEINLTYDPVWTADKPPKHWIDIDKTQRMAMTLRNWNKYVDEEQWRSVKEHFTQEFNRDMRVSRKIIRDLKLLARRFRIPPSTWRKK